MYMHIYVQNLLNFEAETNDCDWQFVFCEYI